MMRYHILIFVLFSSLRITAVHGIIEKPSSPQEAYTMQQTYEKIPEKIRQLEKSIKEHTENLAETEKREKVIDKDLKSGLAKRRRDIEEETYQESTLQKEQQRIKSDLAQAQADKIKIIKEQADLKEILESTAVKELLASYEKALDNLIEPNKPIVPEQEKAQETIKEKKLWQQIKARIAIFFIENRATFHEVLGNKKTVIEIRKNLDTLYQDFDKNSLIARARNYKKLAVALGDLPEKIKSHLDALSLYQKAFGKEAITQSKKEAMAREMQNTVVDLLRLGSAINHKEINAETQETISKHIDETMRAIGIDANMRTNLQGKAGIAKKELTNDEIKQKQDMIKKDIDTVIQALKKQPITALRDAFFNQLVSIEKAEIPNFYGEENWSVRDTVANAYADLAQALWPRISEKGLSIEDRILLLTKFLEFAKKSIKEKVLEQKIFQNYSSLHAREPKPEEISRNMPLPTGTEAAVQQTLTKLLAEFKQNRDNPKVAQKSYDALTKQLQEYDKLLDNAQISTESLAIETWIINNIHGNLIDTINVLSKQKGIDSFLIRVMVDQISDLDTSLKKLATDQAALIKKGPKKAAITTLEVVKASDQPTNKSQKKQPIKINAGDAQQSLFEQIRNRSVKLNPIEQNAPPPADRSTVADQLNEVINARFKATQNEQKEINTDDEGWD